jgi:hypothetical protein
MFGIVLLVLWNYDCGSKLIQWGSSTDLRVLPWSSGATRVIDTIYFVNGGGLDEAKLKKLEELLDPVVALASDSSHVKRCQHSHDGGLKLVAFSLYFLCVARDLPSGPSCNSNPSPYPYTRRH